MKNIVFYKIYVAMIICVFFVFTIVSCMRSEQGYYDKENKVIKIPEGDIKPVLLDGIFSETEWDDALKVDVNQNFCLFFKKNAGHIFIGVKYTKFNTSMADIFLSPNDKDIYHLHTSAQISERMVYEDSGPWDNPNFRWGYSVDWYANEIRWDQIKRDSLVKAGVESREIFKRTFYYYDGFEFQIKKSRFNSNKWLFRISTSGADSYDNPDIFPENTEMKNTNNWIELILE